MTWLVRFINWLADQRLAAAKRRAILDPNARCPGCGNRKGQMELKEVTKTNGQVEVMIEHRCLVCKALFYEPALADPKKWISSRPQVGGKIKRIPPPINDEKPFSPGK